MFSLFTVYQSWRLVKTTVISRKKLLVLRVFIWPCLLLSSVSHTAASKASKQFHASEWEQFSLRAYCIYSLCLTSPVQTSAFIPKTLRSKCIAVRLLCVWALCVCCCVVAALFLCQLWTSACVWEADYIQTRGRSAGADDPEQWIQMRNGALAARFSSLHSAHAALHQNKTVNDFV